MKPPVMPGQFLIPGEGFNYAYEVTSVLEDGEDWAVCCTSWRLGSDRVPSRKDAGYMATLWVLHLRSDLSKVNPCWGEAGRFSVWENVDGLVQLPLF